MKLAMFAISPDARQRAHAAVVRPSWEAFARSHGLPLFVLSSPPRAEHPYWGKYFALEAPGFAAFDAALVIDNDVLIRSGSPSPADGWQPDRILIGDEREQFGWTRKYVVDYFAYYDWAVPDQWPQPRVHNTGVLLYTRQQLEFFREIHARWLAWRNATSRENRARAPFKYANDQPHIGFAIQERGLAQPLDMCFNRLWWSWWQDKGRRREFPFKLYAKGTKIASRLMPDGLARRIAQPGVRQLERALDANHFLHFAGSKSPLYLWSHHAEVLASVRPDASHST